MKSNNPANLDNCNLWSRFINALRNYEVYFREASATSHMTISTFGTEKVINFFRMFGALKPNNLKLAKLKASGRCDY